MKIMYVWLAIGILCVLDDLFEVTRNTKAIIAARKAGTAESKQSITKLIVVLAAQIVSALSMCGLMVFAVLKFI